MTQKGPTVLQPLDFSPTLFDFFLDHVQNQKRSILSSLSWLDFSLFLFSFSGHLDDTMRNASHFYYDVPYEAQPWEKDQDSMFSVKASSLELYFYVWIPPFLSLSVLFNLPPAGFLLNLLGVSLFFRARLERGAVGRTQFVHSFTT